MNAVILSPSSDPGASAEEMSRLRARNETLLAENMALAAELGRMRRQLEARETGRDLPPDEEQTGESGQDGRAPDPEKGRLQAELEERHREIARLTQMLEDRDSPQRAIAEAMTKERDALRDHAAGLEYAQSAMLDSTSWRLTAPLRGLVRWVRGQPRSEPFRPRHF